MVMALTISQGSIIRFLKIPFINFFKFKEYALKMRFSRMAPWRDNEEMTRSVTIR